MLLYAYELIPFPFIFQIVRGVIGGLILDFQNSIHVASAAILNIRVNLSLLNFAKELL